MDTLKKKNSFGSSIGFILAAAGSAIGLGNLWSFPYKTAQYGGAAFVLTYIACVILFGFVVIIAEMYIGKRAQANPISAYKSINKKFGWLGIFAIIIPLIITCYYSVLGGYTIKFAMNSFNGNVNILPTFSANVGEVILYTAIFLVLALIIVMGGIKGGIEKASKFLMPTLFLIILAVAIYSLTLGEGVLDGLDYYLNPKFDKLGFNGVLGAMSQAFYSLSLGMGIMVSYGSYTGKEIKLGKSAIMICVFDTCVALLAGLAIFPAIFHYKAIGGTVSEFEGMFLMFETLPLIFDSLGGIGQIISFAFFAMVSIAAITSVISLLEVITQFIIQKFKINRKKSILFVSVFCFTVSIFVGISLGYWVNKINLMVIFNMNWFIFFDTLTNTVLMPICAFGSCFTLGWLLDKKITFNPNKTLKTLNEDGLTIGKLDKLFVIMLKYVSPVLILMIEIFGVKDLILPNGTFNKNGLAVILTAIIILVLAIIVYFTLLYNKHTGKNEDELTIN